MAYGNVVLNGVTIDDEFVYSNNHFVRHLANLPLLFDPAYFQYSNEASYRPVCTVTYFLDAALWREWAGGPHLVNLALHVAVVCLWFHMFRRLTGNPWAAFVGAGLFAIHPVQTEAVNNISFREDLLVGLFLPVSWLLYKRAEANRYWLWAPLGWMAYALGLFSKEMAVVFPILFVLVEATLVDWHWDRMLGRRRLLFMAGLVVCTLFFVIIRFHLMRSAGETGLPRLGGTWAGTLAADIKIHAHYLTLFFLPTQFSALYPPETYAATMDSRFAFSVAILAVVVSFALYFRRSRFFALGVLWWFVSLLPVSNFHPIFNPMAERYLYLPSVGVCLWLGWAFATVLKSKYQRLLIAAACATALVLAAVTFQRNRVWRNNLTLWTATALESGDDPRLAANLGTAYFEKGDYTRAIELSRKALEAAPTFPGINPAPIHLCVASAWMQLGKLDQALPHLLQVEARIPVRFDIDAAAYRNLGILHDEQGDLRTALKYYQHAVAVDPFRADLWRKLAYAQYRLGDVKDARGNWQKARDLDQSIPSFEAVEAAHRSISPTEIRQP